MVTIHSTAIVATPHVGEGTVIKEFAVIRNGARIGSAVVIHPHVVIEDGVIIGDGVEIFPGAYVGKEPKGAGALARMPVFEKTVTIGENCSIGPHAIIYYDVNIGANTLVGDGASIREQCRIGTRCIISRYVTINYHTSIGDGTKIMDLTHITGNAIIGNRVFISLNVGSANDNDVGRGYREGEVIGPTIEDGAFIGAGATLLPGVRIGAGAVVGAGSLVHKDVEPGSLVVGNPARFIRKVES